MKLLKRTVALLPKTLKGWGLLIAFTTIAVATIAAVNTEKGRHPDNPPPNSRQSGSLMAEEKTFVKGGNVRVGPGTNHPVCYTLPAETKLTPTTANADGSWLGFTLNSLPTAIANACQDKAADDTVWISQKVVKK